ncbi:uncharacterized protein CC84DRAFT_98854 [Paraphaeosphaeria sporulosa]|uniref:Uncharacterized protein n=1 Tax=Paraphaeosphaeria sporulosa TaxID=1460663 RepID=A0A177CZG1_9PLEO|nr:uncharacterized protein CC84DRAFT_98854 [Paraphaeosphaeria sporulosa]OAG12292.1 hypothetical protein CC84DRAFT_98854 [Paraphaeosphaeria sporulosa]
MSPPRPQSRRLHGRTNDQRQTRGLCQARDLVDGGNPTLPPGQDPFAYYKAFRNTDASSTSSSQGADQHGGGATRSQPGANAQSALGCAEQQQNRSRPVPHSVAVRLATQSNGVPLPTIVEQFSISTLNSHGSLCSVGRFPSIRAVEDASHGHTRSLDDGALRRIQEEDRDEQTVSSDANINIQPKVKWGTRSKSYHTKATAAGSVSLTAQKSPIPQTPELNLNVEPKSLKGFIRGVLTKVRGNTRDRSRSSSGTNVLMTDQWSDVSPSAQTDKTTAMIPDSQEPLPFVSATTSLLQPTPSSPHHVSEPQVISASSPKSKATTLPNGFTSQSHGSTSTSETETAPVGLHLPLIPDLSRFQFGNEVLPSVCSVAPPPRDAVLDHVRHAATTVLGRSRNKLATRYTPEGAFILCNDEGSLDDFVRNASRNASFCSTMSTSYSGTVLGIDLDMQHDFPHPTRRSVTSVWFSPKEPARTQETPKPTLQLEGAKPLRPCSITSSALTSLLPIAAVDGIVQQNLAVPQLTFYPPPRNLTQAQSTSPTPTPTWTSRSHSESNFSGTTTPKTSYYNGATSPSAQSALSAAVASPSARPALVPLTTLPHSIAPLPEHLRHHHNYHRVDKSSIGSACDFETMLPSQIAMINDSQVLGCGGMVQPANLDPHSGVLQHPPKRSRIGQSMSCLRVRDRNRLAINTWSSLASNSSRERRGRTPAKKIRKKGKILQTRRVPHIDTVPDKDVIGPAAGHALRVCFCQPYDGVDRQTTGVGCGGAAASQLGEDLNESCASPTGLHESTPNARIVAKANSKGKGRARRDSALGVGAWGRQSGDGSDIRWDASLP